MTPAATKIAFALDGLIRSRTKGHGGDEYAHKCIREIAEGIDALVYHEEPAAGGKSFLGQKPCNSTPTDQCPPREQQNVRKELDRAIIVALRRFFSGFDRDEYLPKIEQQMKGLDAPKESDAETTRRLYVKGGFTYEIAVRCVAWPGMNS